jgi:hypothetical protein
MLNEFDVMIGVTMVSVKARQYDEALIFTAEDGRRFEFFHHQDCCESVCIEEIIGDLDDLVGSPLVMAEEIDNKDARVPEHAESYMWTFYRFGTSKGSVTVRFLGQSNGYYGEDVSFHVIHP